MRAMLLRSPGKIDEQPLEFSELPIPLPAPGQVRLRVRVCGVCRTDLQIVEGDIHPPVLPVIPGHQIVGQVEALGEGVTRFSLGARLGLPWLYSTCGECRYCQRNEENLCPRARFTGFDVNGGFAEYMTAEACFVLPVPENFSDEQAAPLLCAGIIGYRSLRQAEVRAGERLGLFGFGASAHLTIQVARYWDCEVYVFTRSAEHRRHAEELGAAWVGAAEDETPKELDRAIIFAPAGCLVPLALQKLRPGGTLAINAIHMSDLPQMSYQLLYGERTLRSVANATYRDGIEFLGLAAQIPLQVNVQSYQLEEANLALMDLKNSCINGEAVLKVE